MEGDARDATGTIPAGAGSSGVPRVVERGLEDHPRGCGEQLRREDRIDGKPGPSPRVRGAVAGRVLHSPGQGTIPAGAGSRSPRRTSSVHRRDHPRGCGEQIT